MLFKTVGLLMIFFACCFSGIYKSSQLKKRKEKLSYLMRSSDDMAERIRAQASEAEYLISACFEKNSVFMKNGKIDFNRNFLEKEDIDLLDEFFGNFGMRDVCGEYERSKFYVKLLQKQFAEAEIKCTKLCRLYNSLGILSGIFLCIFLL